MKVERILHFLMTSRGLFHTLHFLYGNQWLDKAQAFPPSTEGQSHLALYEHLPGAPTSTNIFESQDRVSSVSLVYHTGEHCYSHLGCYEQMCQGSASMACDMPPDTTNIIITGFGYCIYNKILISSFKFKVIHTQTIS